MTITGGRLIRAMLDDEDGHSESTNVKDDWNERIRQLAEQATSSRIEYDPKTMMTERIQEFDKEKFAELIVNECAEWVNDNVGLIDEEAKADLLKHFGVE